MAILRATYDKQEDIPEAHRPLYAERDGKFELTEVEGIKTQADFDRFETALRKRLKDATDKLDGAGGAAGLSKDEIRTLMTEVMTTFVGGKGGSGGNGGGGGGSGGGGSGGGGDSAALHDLERRLSAVETENKALKTERDQYKGQAANVTLETQLTRGALAAGVDSSALDMLVRLTKDDFELDGSGKAVVKLDPSVKGVTPNADPTAYFKHIATDDVFKRFWPASQGGGSGGGGGGGGGGLGTDNPFSKAGWNKTKQSELVRTNPTEAERLSKIAGVTFGATKPNR